MSYSLDTSAMLDAWVRYYPPDVFGSVWAHMDALAASGRLFAIDEVSRELANKDDGSHKWVKARSRIVVSLTTEIQARAAVIINQFPSLTDSNSMMRGGADPFVIALAIERSLTVVCSETSKPSKPRIPDVCKALSVPCIGLVDLFRAEKWSV